MKALPELTAFCSTYEKFKKTDFALFDSIYLGTPYCLSVKGNLVVDTDNLRVCIRELKELNIKAYVTTPAVPIGNDFNIIRKMLEVASEENIDGVEIFDMGVFRILKNEFPGLKIHIGHYANVYNQYSAKAFLELGASRIIPSYELTFNELSQLASVPDISLEVVVHGKLAIGYANACLLRLEFPDRNIKPCTQQCDNEYFVRFSDWKMKSAGYAMLMGEDSCMIDRLPYYVQAGFKTLRLDTITDTPEKINKLGNIYRKALNIIGQDEMFNSTELLEKVRNISGNICNGWHTGTSGREFMLAIEEHMGLKSKAAG